MNWATDNHKGGDPFTLIIILLIIGVGLSKVLLDLVSDEVHELTTFIAWIHIKPFAFLVRVNSMFSGLPFFGDWIFVPSQTLEPLINPWGSYTLGGQYTAFVQLYASRAAVVVYLVPVLVMIWIARCMRPDIKYRKIHNLDSLIDFQSKYWVATGIAKHIKMLRFERNRHTELSMNDTNHNANNLHALGYMFEPMNRPQMPDWGSQALNPEHWLQEQHFFPSIKTNNDYLVSRINDDGILSDDNWKKLTIDAICEAFEAQFNEIWTGFERLKHYERALVAVFACFYDFKIKQGQNLLDHLSVLADRKIKNIHNFDTVMAANRRLLNEVDAVLASCIGLKLLNVANQHAWKVTAFQAMIHYARKDRSVLSSASFLWLKYVDRLLWYTLNNTGNTVAMVEAAGVHAHYKAECQMQCPLYLPASYQSARTFLEYYLDQIPAHVARRQRIAATRKSTGAKIAEYVERAH